jgi:serine/threonine-protein kinase
MSDQQGAHGNGPRLGANPAQGASGWPPNSDTHEVIPPSKRSAGLKLVTISPGTATPGTGSVQPGKQDPYLGCTIDDRYLVEAVLGEGGMGVVYRCTHKIIGKKVAMKVLRADLARDAEVTERFLNEAKAASAIGNPHIIDISDFGQFPDGSTYFIMEFLDGTPLSNVVEGGAPVAVPRILHIARQLSEGLSAAHQAGIVHRDLKPDNIYLIKRGKEADFVKILDFGIAKVSTAGDGKLTRAGAVFGTPHYMSPEQAAGAPIDHRGDIYSFGVILYELASGKVPFDADNFMGILTQHMYKSPVPIRALVPQPQDVPPGLEAIVLKCLSKRPEQRYQSMDEVILDLDKLREGTIPDAVSEMMARSGGFNVPADYFKPTPGKMPAPMPATPAGVARTKSRWPVYAGLAGVLVAIGIVVAIFAQPAPSTASPEPGGAHPITGAPVPPQEKNDPPSKQVLLAVEPLDAHVYKGSIDLGTSPLVLDLNEGEIVALRVQREGYKPQELQLDSKEARRTVKLEKIQAPASASKTAAASAPAPRARAKQPPPDPAASKPKAKQGIGGGEIVNPWGD